MVNESIINNDSDCHVPPIDKRLWVIEYEVNNKLFGQGKGCAVIKAGNAAEAERLLKADGVFNGNPFNYRIIRIAEVIPSPESMLLAEVYEVIEKDGGKNNGCIK